MLNYGIFLMNFGTIIKCINYNEYGYERVVGWGEVGWRLGLALCLEVGLLKVLWHGLGCNSLTRGFSLGSGLVRKIVLLPFPQNSPTKPS